MKFQWLKSQWEMLKHGSMVLFFFDPLGIPWNHSLGGGIYNLPSMSGASMFSTNPVSWWKTPKSLPHLHYEQATSNVDVDQHPLHD